MSGNVTIRDATVEDLDSITEIYNDAILRTVASFDTTPKNADEQLDWFLGHDSGHPILVAIEAGGVVGWASLSKWSDRCAYSGTAEVSLYVAEKFRGRGVGRKLLKSLMAKGQEAGLHTVVARIVEGNIASVGLFGSEGFENVGLMKEVGCKFGKLLNVVMMQKIYGSYKNVQGNPQGCES